MATAEIRGAQIYFETFGEPAFDRDPVILIHGSYITGSVDWGEVAPLLAREFQVIVPDCRGHGRSSDPAGRYSFREMAADVAELIRQLGFQRAHVIGHSNGGNVALVTLMEHSDVVASCVPQAANAYVSQDLVDRIPKKLDPDRVRIEDPDLMREMIALHSEHHGSEYWKTLLRRTAQEIISEPRYTPADLAKARRPTLVIEGALDATNAPARHGHFIAEHIPGSELWTPDGIGHNVHTEIPGEWCERVLRFLRESTERTAL